MKLTRLRIEFKLCDFWVGAYYRHTKIHTDKGPVKGFTDVWICLVPCLPIHLTFIHNLVVSFDTETKDLEYLKQIGRHYYSGDTTTETGKKWYRWWRETVVGK